jgi:hypothetical protein
MSKSGVYKYDPATGEVIRVSDRIPSLKKPVHWDNGWDHSGYHSEALGCHIRSKDHKRQILEERGLAEAG